MSFNPLHCSKARLEDLRILINKLANVRFALSTDNSLDTSPVKSDLAESISSYQGRALALYYIHCVSALVPNVLYLH